MFGVPRVAEDDALRAVRAAVAMQHAFRELAERYSALVGTTGLRIAVNTGEVVVSDDSEIIGDPVNRVARTPGGQRRRGVRTPEFVEHDHRGLAVLGTTRGAAARAKNFSTLVDLAPDTVYRNDHFRSAARGFCSAGAWVGTRDGGHDEIPLIAVLELDDHDRLARADLYDPDQLDQALARFAELTAHATSRADA
jgi:hypothetical protein